MDYSTMCLVRIEKFLPRRMSVEWLKSEIEVREKQITALEDFIDAMV